jgi:hypothetical protein
MEREYYYYERDTETGKPVITRCLIVNNGHHARGTAICSEKDNFCKAIGRAIAKGRAVKALKTGNDNSVIWRPDAVWALGLVGKHPLMGWPAMKSEYCPPLTDLEKRLIGERHE